MSKNFKFKYKPLIRIICKLKANLIRNSYTSLIVIVILIVNINCYSYSYTTAKRLH